MSFFLFSVSCIECAPDFFRVRSLSNQVRRGHKHMSTSLTNIFEHQVIYGSRVILRSSAYHLTERIGLFMVIVLQ